MSTTAENIGAQQMVTADGTPLKVSLARAKRRAKISALVLVLPLFLFILVTFFIPIITMLLRSVDNPVVLDTLPNTTPLLQQWDETGDEIPDEALFAALAKDFVVGFKNKTIGSAGRRLNYEKPGFSSMFRKTARKAKKFEAP